MRVRVFTVVVLLFFQLNYCGGQIFPREGSGLNYRVIGFSIPALPKTANYKFEIAKGNWNTASEFSRHVFLSETTTMPRLLATVPDFGCVYTWRCTPQTDTHIEAGTMLHFKTLITNAVDSSRVRMRVTTKTEGTGENYVFVDELGVLYDMKGNPVWFVPRDDSEITIDLRDLKVTSQSTITFLYKGPREMKYCDSIVGGPLFCRVSPGATEAFHHEFTRMSNGHYMGLVVCIEKKKYPQFRDSIPLTTADTIRFYNHIRYSVLAEFDQTGKKILWRWRVPDYVRKSDLAVLPERFDYHENSFYFDETKKVIYLSWRSLNRIAVIRYADGKVINTYGPEVRVAGNDFPNPLFCGQHSCGVTADGRFFLYDNNICDTPFAPRVVAFQEDQNAPMHLRKIWEFDCPVDSDAILFDPNGTRLRFAVGGAAQALSGGAYLVLMGTPEVKALIVDKNKNILWSANIETRDESGKHWTSIASAYRAHLISSSQLERLIWNR